jgi:hypothetical protein
MKKLFVPLLCLFLGFCVQSKAQNKVDGAQLKFDAGDVHDFGILQRGPIAMHSFEFTNTGNVPLVIMNVTPSCGCTNVDWPKNPIPPGGKGKIQLGLKTEEQHGVFNKEVYIQSNAVNNPHGDKRYTIYIKGDARDEVKK